jgi:hypothetical protein
MTNVDTAIIIYSYYEFGQGTLETLTPQYVVNFGITNANPVPYEPPIYRNITISNVTASLSTAGQPPVLLLGLPDHPITNLVINSLRVTANSVDNAQIYSVTNVQFINCTWSLPAKDKIQFWNAACIFTNAAPSTNLLILDGLTTNGIGNTLEFDNVHATLANTNAIASGALAFAGTTLTVSNNLKLLPANIWNFTLGTNSTKIAVVGNLSLGGAENIFAGPGFTNGIYSWFTYTGTLGGNLPSLGSVPGGYNYSFMTNVAGQVNLAVTLLAPTDIMATASNLLINLSWNPVAGATDYNLERGISDGGPYSVVYNGVPTNYADGDVMPGTNYYYVVTTDGAGGQSSNSLQIVATPLPSNQPTNLFMQVSNGQMQLGWPPDHLGWRLQIQTNGLNGGLGTNWVTMPGTTNGISAIVPMNTTNGAVFLRLVYP